MTDREIRSYVLRDVWGEAFSSLRRSALRSPFCGPRYALRCWWLAMQVTFDGKARCFDGCGERVGWDPIVGTVCNCSSSLPSDQGTE